MIESFEGLNVVYLLRNFWEANKRIFTNTAALSLNAFYSFAFFEISSEFVYLNFLLRFPLKFISHETISNWKEFTNASTSSAFFKNVEFWKFLSKLFKDKRSLKEEKKKKKNSISWKWNGARHFRHLFIKICGDERYFSISISTGTLRIKANRSS